MEIWKNSVDLVYWCAQLRTRATDVASAIKNIEKEHATEVIDQQCWKDHVSGTRARDAGRILQWLQDNTDCFTRTNFSHFLDGLVMRKLIDLHINHTDHRKEMDFMVELGGTMVHKKLQPHELVHPDWRGYLLVANYFVISRRVRCDTLHFRVDSVGMYLVPSTGRKVLSPGRDGSSDIPSPATSLSIPFSRRGAQLGLACTCHHDGRHHFDEAPGRQGSS